MALSEHEQRQLDEIELALAGDRRRVPDRLRRLGLKVVLVGVALGVSVSVMISVFVSSSSDSALIALGSLILVLLFLINRYVRLLDR